MARIQKLPPIFWLEGINKEGEKVTISLDDKNTYLWFWDNGKKTALIINDTKTGVDQCVSAANKNKGAFASTFIPSLGQHGVYVFSSGGRTKEYALCRNLCAKIQDAYNSVFSIAETVSKKEMPIQVIKAKTFHANDKNDPEKMVVYVCYPGYSKQYAFRCKQWHTNGDEVCVYTGDPKEYKNVRVVKCVTMKESEIIALAKRIGYDDLEEVYSEEPMDFEEYYEENIAELQAERECFMPVADVIIEGDDIDYCAEKARDIEAGLYDNWLPD